MKNGVIYLLAAALLLGAAGLVVFKSRNQNTEPPAPNPQPVVENTTKPPAEDNVVSQKITQMQQIFRAAQADYQKFLAAEKAGNKDERRKYYKHTKIKLDEVINLANSIDSSKLKDTSLVQKAIRLRTDLGKKAYTEDN